MALAPGQGVLLPSPNGATCSRLSAQVPHLLAGALVNAGAVARQARALLAAGAPTLTVVACGERWGGHAGPLRVALEDGLGAGAILGPLLDLGASPEARACAASYQALAAELPQALRDCESGRELIGRGYAADVAHAAQLDRYDVVPALREGWFEAATIRPQLRQD